MTPTMWKIIYILYQLYLERGRDGGYFASWHLEDEIGVKLAGCGVPNGDSALEKLVEMGLIEEVENLGCRFRIVVRDGAADAR